MVVGGVVAIGATAYRIDQYIVSCNEKNSREQKIEEYIGTIERSILMLYYKNDIKMMLYYKNDIKNKKVGMDKIVFNRNHKAIDAYIKYLQESIIEPGQENDRDLVRNLRSYQETCSVYIKQEEILSLHQELRFWCAYHKVGEFTPKNLKKRISIL